MKHLFILFFSFILLSCQNKKIGSETVQSPADTTTAPTPATLTTPLAFDPLENYVLKSTVKPTDSVDLFIISTQEQFNNLFEALKTASDKIIQPDFIINYTVGVVCKPTDKKTTINIEKAEFGDFAMNVFVKIEHGEKENSLSTPARVFAIEKRNGISRVDFFINGQKSKSIELDPNL